MHHHTTLNAPRTRPHIASRALRCIAFLLLVAASPVAASASLPALTEVTPWSARCYTDTCVGFLVRFEGGHTVALGYPADAPEAWAIRASSDLTADEAALAAATLTALQRRDLPGLAAAYPTIPPWYLEALAAAVVPTTPTYMLFLPVVRY